VSGLDRVRQVAANLGLSEPTVLASIWATVDIERSAADLGSPCEEMPPDPHLGARVCVVRADGEAVALVEPATEGRLARHLARYDEGPAGAYVTWPGDVEAVLGRFRAAGAVLTSVEAGPFGPSALVLSGPGASLVVVGPPAATPAGTIGR
jgi:hypothetical protein